MKIHAVIPTRFHPPQLAELLKVLIVDNVEWHVIESWSFNHRIYAMWNAGVRSAQMGHADYVAVLNDDIVILPGTLRSLAEVLEREPNVGVVYPDASRATAQGFGPVDMVPTKGTWGAGGMTGFCFVFRADLGVEFNDAYNWWYGDDDFEERVRSTGLLVARVTGLPIDHTPSGSASRVWTEISPLIDQDRARWDALHAEVRA